VARDTRLSRVADACALLTATIGLLVAVGWGLDIDSLKRVLPGLAAMKFNTALAFVLAGAGLWWRKRRSLRLALGALVALLGALSLVEYLAGQSFGIDQILVRDIVAAPESAFPPGRMAPSTALCFLLLGVALIGISDLGRRIGSAVELLALVAAVIGAISLMAFPTGAVYLRQWPGFVSMALHTAAAFVALGVGILCAAEGMVVRSLGLRGTGRVLWVGFGVLTCLLATVGIVFSVNMQTLADDVHAQANVARPRKEATSNWPITFSATARRSVWRWLATRKPGKRRRKRPSISTATSPSTGLLPPPYASESWQRLSQASGTRFTPWARRCWRPESRRARKNRHASPPCACGCINWSRRR